MSQYWIEVRKETQILIPRISVTESEYNFIRENMLYYSNDIIRKIEKESNNKNIYYEYIKKDVNGLEFQLIKSEEVTIEIKKSENFSGYKIKLSEFIHSEEHLAIHCTSSDDTITILKHFGEWVTRQEHQNQKLKQYIIHLSILVILLHKCWCYNTFR